MSDTRSTFFRRVLGDERGIALPYALGVTMVLSALAAGIFSYVTTNQTSTSRAGADQRAYGIAETGLSYAVSTLKNAADPTSPTAVPVRTVTLPAGSVTYSGSLSGNVWTLTSTGTVANPSGPGSSAVVRNVSIQALVGAGGSTPDMTVWEYLFIDAPISCTKLENGNLVQVSVYVRGDLCMQNDAEIRDAPKVHVLGSVYITNTARIGASGDNVGEFRRTGNCYRDGSVQTCGPSARIWANTIGTGPPVLAKPTINLTHWYNNADLGPKSGCTTGSFPPGFDNNSTLDVSKDKVDLTPGSAYDCKKVVSGQTVGQIKWQPGSPGTLTIKGAIYVDGHFEFKNDLNIVYDGQAVLYASGMLTIQDNTKICAVAACDATWNPSADMFMLVIGSRKDSSSTTDPKSVEIKNYAKFQGGIYAVNDVFISNSAEVWGSIISRGTTVSNSAKLYPTPGVISYMYGAPHNTSTTLGVTIVPGSYSG